MDIKGLDEAVKEFLHDPNTIRELAQAKRTAKNLGWVSDRFVLNEMLVSWLSNYKHPLTITNDEFVEIRKLTKRSR